MPKRVVALGFFDGVHRGHCALLRTAAGIARQTGAQAAAISFDAHPSALLSGRATGLLTTPAERLGLMQRECGVGELLLLPWNQDLMQLPWQRFVEEYLISRFAAVHVVCGADFRFGWRGAGTAQLLQDYCAAHGLGCTVVAQVKLDGVPVSSTLIRSLLARGALHDANALLGHPYCLTGRIVHGSALGRRLGFPTANLPLPQQLLRPRFGVYACRAVVDGTETHPAVINLGVKPTVQQSGEAGVEAWLLDYDGDLYGHELRLDFIRYLRPERRFDSLEALRAEVHKNAAQARALLQA